MPADRPERRRSRGPSSYTVGYGKLPLETRFTPGRSGNPKGRPSARKNLRTEVREALTAPIMVTMDGRKVKMSKRQAMLEKQTAKALSGCPRATALLLGLGERYLSEEPGGAPMATTQEDLAIIAAFAERLEDERGAP
jgi:hypothetical protein